MEEILNQLQEIQREAVRMHTPVFDITYYHWRDKELSDVLTVRAVRDEFSDDDSYYGRIHADCPEEAVAVITQLKIYLGL